MTAHNSITCYVRYILSRPNIVFFLTASLLLFVFQFIQQFIVDLAYHRALIENQEYWRLLTGGLVHANTAHLLLNIAGLFCLLMLYEHQITTQVWCGISLLLVFCVNIAIYVLLPSTEFYLGFSGALHGLYTWYSIVEWARKRSWFPVCVILLLMIKLGIDALSGNNLSSEIIGMRVHWQSHWIGSLAGVVLALAYKRKAA